MLKEIFIGKNISSFRFNTIVKAFIISETFLWSAWNFVIPIFPIFVATHVNGGNIAIAASAYSTYLLARLLFDIISSRYIFHMSEVKKFLLTILGITLVSIAYLGFAYSVSVIQIFFFYAIAGIGIGVGYPAKLSLFSGHLDKDKEAVEWGILDSTVIAGTALAASLGGFIATEYGFPMLFAIASAVSILGIVPYILYINKTGRHLVHTAIK